MERGMQGSIQAVVEDAAVKKKRNKEKNTAVGGRVF